MKKYEYRTVGKGSAKKFEYRTVKEGSVKKAVFMKLFTVQIINLVALVLPILALLLIVTGDRGAGAGYAESLYTLWIVGINLLIVEPLICARFGIFLAGKPVNIWSVSILCAGLLPLGYILILFALAVEPETLIYGGIWFVWLFIWTVLPAIIARKAKEKTQE